MENIFLGVGGVLVAFGGYLKYEKTLINPLKVTPSQAKQLIHNGAKVLDVRTQLEYNLGHYPGAIHLTYNQLTPTNLGQAGVTKSTTIVVYCNSGTRARKASERLVSIGYNDVHYIVETYLSLT